MIHSKKAGALMVILRVLLVVFIVGSVWMIYNKPMDDISSKVVSDLPADDVPTYNRIMGFWNNWPIYTIIVAMIAGVVSIVWKGGQDHYGGPPPGYG